MLQNKSTMLNFFDRIIISLGVSASNELKIDFYNRMLKHPDVSFRNKKILGNPPLKNIW